MTIRRMSAQDLRLVLDWAATEGWNPGLDDAAAFLAADPDGFFLNTRDGEPVAAISVVNHSPDHAFLGLYICRPDMRGRGYGMEVWSAGMAHAGARCVGLDGVPEQQANYARSGFTRAGRTIRFAGQLDPVPADTPAHQPDLAKTIDLDRQATGTRRTDFARAWFTDTARRKTISLSAADPSEGFATIRQCRDGLKIGPFHAPDEASARQVLDAAAATFGPATLYIDVPESAPQMIDLLTSLTFAPVFETARMYTGAQPSGRPPPFYAGATLELG